MQNLKIQVLMTGNTQTPKFIMTKSNDISDLSA